MIASDDTLPGGVVLLKLARRLGVHDSRRVAAVRPAVLRAVRVYAPAALEAAGLPTEAATLRALPDDVSFEEAMAAVLAARQAATRKVDVASSWPEEEDWAERAADWAANAANAADAWEADAAAFAAFAAFAAEAARQAEWAAAWAEARAHGARPGTIAAGAAADAAQRAEHLRCADDVRLALPGLQALLDAAIAAAPCTPSEDGVP